MEEVEEGVVYVAENDSTTYSQIIEFQDQDHIDIPPPPSLPPQPSSSIVDEEQVEEKDDFVQRNPLAQLEDEVSDQPKHVAFDSPTTIEPQVVTTPSYAVIVPPSVKENVRDDVVDKAKTEIESSPLASTVHSKYSGRYIGSIRLPEGDLVGDKCAATLTECITTVSKGSKKANKVIYEFKENQKVILKLEERELKLTTDEKNANVISCHLFRKIRAWAVGKETDSHHFAYVVRSPDEIAGYSYVCRVFKCSVKAREVATAIRIICQRRAAMRADNNNYMY